MGYWVTVVDDEPLSLTNAKMMLNKHDMHVSCLRTGKKLIEFLEKNAPDLILLDVLMPDMDGFETYRAIRQFEERERKSQTPVIFLTGEDSNETERRGLKAGASDFIHKPFDEDILIKRIKNTIVNSKTIESLTEEAALDRLTGFFNKASGTEKVAELCKNTSGALAILDLDNFKLVNDLYGHDMGDSVLVSLAGVIRKNVRSDDVVCRVGGDEFMVYLPDMTQKEAVSSLAQRLNADFLKETASLMGADHGLPLGISVGVALVSDDTNDYQILFRCADSALYEVKRNGKHGCEIYDPDISCEDGEENLERDLERVLQVVSERGNGMGAMLLGQDAFSWNYRFIERFALRYGGTVTRMLFSLSSEEKGIIFSEMVAEFGIVLKNTLRKSDIIFQWQHNRYLVVLPQLKEKDIQVVTSRIMDAWAQKGYMDRLDIRQAVSVRT